MDHETRETLLRDIDAVGVSVSLDQIERWRGEGLLPRVVQTSLGGSAGTETRYPIGTARQAIELATLLESHRKFDVAGWELWWRGYPVDQKWWAPALARAAKSLDAARAFLAREVRKDERRSTTVADRLAKNQVNGVPLGRIKQRLSGDQLAAVFGVVTQVATGEFEQFEPEAGGGSFDEQALLKGLGHVGAEGFGGQTLWLPGIVSPVLGSFSRIWKKESASAFLSRASQEVIEAARDDVRAALETAGELHAATSWIFGRNSLGLNLATLFSKRAPRLSKSVVTLAFAMTRTKPDNFLSSTEIAHQLSAARALNEQSKVLRALVASPPSGLEGVLTVNRVRLAARSEEAMSQYLRDISQARNLRSSLLQK